MADAGSRVRSVQSENQFERILNGSNAPKKLVVVDWNADWCGPCKKMSPAFAKLSVEHPRAVFLSVNVDECKELAQSKGVKALPTFMFYKGSEKLIDETFQGADVAKLEEKVKRLSGLIDPFTGQGHSLSGPSASSSAPGQQEAPQQPRRFNPWANPSFKPPMSKAKEEAEKRAAEEAEAAKKKQEAEQRASRNNPWSNPEFKPKDAPPGTNAPASGTNAETDPELAMALKMSMTDAEEPNADGESSGSKPDAMDTSDPSPSEEGNDPRLLKSINQQMLVQLLDFGFARVRSEKALILTKSVNMERAMDWLLQHENDADVDEPLKVVGSAPKPAEPDKVWKANERGAPLGWKAGVEYVDSDEDDPHASALMKKIAKKKKKREMVAADPNAEPEPPKKPLTTEEKLQELEKKREKSRHQKAIAEREATREREKRRQHSAKEVAELQRSKKERESRVIMERRKREKAREKAAKKAIKEKIKADKERRRRENAERKAIADARKAQGN